MRDRTVFLLLLGICALVRVPFLRAFDLVAYDGVYYINQAKSMVGLTPGGGAFPIGYPACIAILLPVVRDGVRAAQIVSLAAGVGSVWLLYLLGKTLVSKRSALVAALILAVTPLFIRLSLTTLSESAFVFWMLLGLYLFQRGKEVSFGAAMGMATVTRPEAVGIFILLLLWRRRSWKRLGRVLTAFAILYAVNIAALSITTGRFVLLPKSEFFGTSAARWQGREAWVDFPGKEDYDEVLDAGPGANVFYNAVRRFPLELLLLARHVMPVALVLAVFGLLRKRLHILAGFVPLLFYPFFTVRSEPRYVLPYVPLVIVFAAIGLEMVREAKWRAVALWLLAASAVAGVVVNRDQLTEPVSDGFQWAKRAGLAWRERLRPDDRIADRKPYFAFYAGAAYVPIPIGPYEVVLNHLVEDDVRLLVLHRPTIEFFRPALLPLLEDRDVIRGELRFRQADVDPDEYSVYERTGASDPLVRKRITPPGGGILVVPTWSPDGEWIAYRSLGPDGVAGLFVVRTEGGEPRCVLAGPKVNDPVAWSPDSKRIALAVPSEGGGSHIAILDLVTAEAERVTKGNGRSPSWSRDGREIVYVSNRTGRDEIWSADVATGGETRITSSGGHTYPAISPQGNRIAWLSEREGLVILDRASGRRSGAALSKRVSYAPSWSPDGRFIAVTAEVQGGVQVYLLTEDGRETLMLTKSAGNGMASWSPDGRRMVVVTNEDGDYGLWVLSGLDAYKDRLLSPVPVTTVEGSE